MNGSGERTERSRRVDGFRVCFRFSDPSSYLSLSSEKPRPTLGGYEGTPLGSAELTKLGWAAGSVPARPNGVWQMPIIPTQERVSPPCISRPKSGLAPIFLPHCQTHVDGSGRSTWPLVGTHRQCKSTDRSPDPTSAALSALVN